jgi:hypothetical protein
MAMVPLWPLCSSPTKKLAKLDLTGAELSTEEVVMVAVASNRLQVLVLDGSDVDSRGLDALAQAMMKVNFLRVLDLKDANVTDGGRNQQALVRFCVGLEKNKTLKDLGCALPPTQSAHTLSTKARTKACPSVHYGRSHGHF